MGVLNHIVETLVLAMFDTGQEAAFCRGITAQLVGDQDTGHILTADQQLTQEADRRLLIAMPVHHNLKHLAMLVDRAVQILRFPVDLDEDLINVPLVTCLWAMPTDASCIGMAELETPIPDRFVADRDPTLGQNGFYIAVTQVEIEVEPDGMGDDFSWIPMPFVGGLMMCIRHRDSID